MYCVLNEAMLLAYRPYSWLIYFRDMTAILVAGCNCIGSYGQMMWEFRIKWKERQERRLILEAP